MEKQNGGRERKRERGGERERKREARRDKGGWSR
jgi:hypothetical protein